MYATLPERTKTDHNIKLSLQQIIWYTHVSLPFHLFKVVE